MPALHSVLKVQVLAVLDAFCLLLGSSCSIDSPCGVIGVASDKGSFFQHDYLCTRIDSLDCSTQPCTAGSNYDDVGLFGDCVPAEKDDSENNHCDELNLLHTQPLF